MTSQKLGWCLGVSMVIALFACGDNDVDPVVGSGQEGTQVVEAMFVERVTIDIPFKAVVHDGDERQIVLRGEDNLIELIDVVESDVAEWEIVAPPNLDFEQHQDIHIEIPFIGMVGITVSGDVDFADHPAEVWGPGDADTTG